MGKLLYRELTFAIIGAAMEVHSQLGYGFLELVYERALTHELALRGMAVETQCPLKVVYKKIEVGQYVADMVVENKILVELKATSKGLAKEHQAQTIHYLVATGYQVGLLLNFGKPSLEHKRFVRSNEK